MKRKRKAKLLLGYAGFFFMIALTVSVAMFVYGSIRSLKADAIALIMFGAIVALAAACTAADFFRRKFTVDKPVAKILAAAERIAAGDFSVRLETAHPFKRGNEFDSIMENLNRMAEELSRNEVLKTDFISNVSHEIKTPLSVIQNYAAALQSDKLSAEERKKYAQTLMGASKRLTDLVVNILKLDKLENQRLVPEMQEVRLDEMLAQAIFGLEELIERKGLEIECDLGEVSVRTSPSHLEIVWNNLLSNAIKFTPPGGKISVSLNTDRGRASVTIADTGCGMSEETGRHIFDKFYQGDTSHAEEGNGLGLALVKKVIDVLGGEIAVESEVGKGSAFTVLLKGEANEGKK